MNVLSLFDGMSCGQIALNRIGIKPSIYYASEIDKYAQIVSKANYPDTVYLGDVRNVDVGKLEPIDLLIGGSPCQSFSFAGKRKGMSTKDNIEILSLEHYLELKEQQFEFEGQSYLFWEYMRILNDIRKHNSDVKFLLENVIMGDKWQKVLTQAIGINPIRINSALLSAQNRDRLYWTNIGAEPDGLFGDLVCKIPQPKNMGILLRDILQDNPNSKYYLSDKMLNYFNTRAANFNNGKINIRDIDGKSTTITASCKSIDISDNFIAVPEKYFLSEKSLKYINRNPRNISFQMDENDEKSICLTANFSKQIPYNQIVCHNMMPRSSKNGNGGTGHLTRNDEKTYCLDTGQTNAVEYGFRIRRLTPLECERLQTVPDNYTNYVSDTQRYKMLGNGWTVSVISYIFSYLSK